MAFDPSKPSHGSTILSAELRDQFNSLKAMYDAQQAQIIALQSQVATLLSVLAAVQNVDTSNTDINNPVTGEQGQNLLDKINELIMAMKT